MSDKENVNTEDLQASLAKLEAFAKSNDTPSRKEELLSKAGSAELTEVERTELFGLLGGAPVNGGVAETLTKGLTENAAMRDALDVSGYLTEQHQELVKSLAAVGTELEKSSNRQSEFNLILAKAITDIGGLVKSMDDRMTAYEAQPARAPKSQGVPSAAPLQKAFGGQSPAGEQMTKSQVLDTLDAMHQFSMQKGGNDGLSPSGEDLMRAIAKYEMTSMLSPGLLKDVQNFRAQQH
jgi:hypothetical protein